MPPPTTAELLPLLFGRAEHPLARWYAGPLDASAPLRAFAEQHAAKIRKKARLATDADTARDLQCELAVAALLADRHSPLVYEPLAAEPRRGPDFLLRHKGHTLVYVEASRVRPRAAAARDPHERLAAQVCGKLTQVAADGANLLVLISDDVSPGPAALGPLIQGLRRRADAGDDAYFAFRSLEGVRAFHRQIARLSAVALATTADGGGELYELPGARRPLPAALARAVARWELAALVGPPG